MGIRPRNSMSRGERIRTGIYVGALVLVFTQAGLYASAPAWPLSSTASAASAHPIATLMADAEAAFRATLARQSRTLPDAVAEYTRRHARPPPRGFDAWWAFAQAHNVVLVDEFDSISEDLAPFWEFSGAEFRARAHEVGSACVVHAMES
jgi:hypothetical protein